MELTKAQQEIYEDLKFSAGVSNERVKDSLLLYAMTPSFEMSDVMTALGKLEKELGRKLK